MAWAGPWVFGPADWSQSSSWLLSWVSREKSRLLTHQVLVVTSNLLDELYQLPAWEAFLIIGSDIILRVLSTIFTKLKYMRYSIKNCVVNVLKKVPEWKKKMNLGVRRTKTQTKWPIEEREREADEALFIPGLSAVAVKHYFCKWWPVWPLMGHFGAQTTQIKSLHYPT